VPLVLHDAKGGHLLAMAWACECEIVRVANPTLGDILTCRRNAPSNRVARRLGMRMYATRASACSLHSTVLAPWPCLFWFYGLNYLVLGECYRYPTTGCLDPKSDPPVRRFHNRRTPFNLSIGVKLQ
jgi:hypothetical protein